MNRSAVLTRDAASLKSTPYDTTANFLSLLARLRISRPEKVGPERRPSALAGDLLAAILASADDPILGPLTPLLIGQAYREIGFAHQMAATYQKARGAVRGELGLEMNYDLADFWYEADQPNREQAKLLFTVIAGRAGSKWQPGPGFARGDRSARRSSPRLLNARSPILQAHRPADPTDLLKLMGQAYEQVGDFNQAARCFAGEVPE